MKASPEQVGWYRAKVMQLDKRLPAGSLAIAAFGGLQDSAPRSALLSLHARVRGVGPAAWEAPELVQVWFRWADYVVPRKDVGVFTLGTLPRDPGQVSALDDLADAVLRVLDGKARSPKEVADAHPDWPSAFLIRSACATGKIHIRWDASRIEVLSARPPKMDPEEARLELARRFLHWMGPAGAAHFAKWAGISREDAQRTWAALARELIPIDFEGRARWLLASDESVFVKAKAVDVVRLLPGGDPYLHLDQNLLTPSDRRLLPEPGPTVSRRLANSMAGGRILASAKLIGAWGRVQNKVTLYCWRRIPKKLIERVSHEASLFETPIGKPIQIRWLS